MYLDDDLYEGVDFSEEIKTALVDNQIECDDNILSELKKVLDDANLSIDDGVSKFASFLLVQNQSFADASILKQWQQHLKKAASSTPPVDDQTPTGGGLADMAMQFHQDGNTHDSNIPLSMAPPSYDTPSKTQKRRADGTSTPSSTQRLRSTPASVTDSPYSATFTQHTSGTTVAFYEGSRFKESSDFLSEAETTRNNDSAVPLLNISYIDFFLRQFRSAGVSLDRKKVVTRQIKANKYRYGPWDDTEYRTFLHRVRHIYESIIASSVFKAENPDVTTTSFQFSSVEKIHHNPQFYVGVITQPLQGFDALRERRDAKLSPTNLYLLALNLDHHTFSSVQISLVNDSTSHYDLFPGQIVILKGTRGSQHTPVQVLRLYSDTTLPKWNRTDVLRHYFNARLPKAQQQQQPNAETIVIGNSRRNNAVNQDPAIPDLRSDRTIRVVQATGPFVVLSPDNEVSYTVSPILDFIKSRTHHVDFLILMGPFIDSKSIPPCTTPSPTLGTVSAQPLPVLSANIKAKSATTSIDPSYNKTARQSLAGKDVQVFVSPQQPASIGNSTHDHLFVEFLQKLIDEKTSNSDLQHVRVVTIPSPDDFHHYYKTYPQPAFQHPQDHASLKEIINLPNPCTFDINGVLFSASNGSVFTDLASSSLYIAPLPTPPPLQPTIPEGKENILGNTADITVKSSDEVKPDGSETTIVKKAIAGQPVKRMERFHQFVTHILSQQCLSPCVNLPLLPKDASTPEEYFNAPARPINNHALDNACETTSFLSYKPDILLLPSVIQYKADALYLPGNVSSHTPITDNIANHGEEDNKVVVVNSQSVAKGQRKGFCALITIRPSPPALKPSVSSMNDEDTDPTSTANTHTAYPTSERTRVDIVQL